VLTAIIHDRVRLIEVLALADRRGPAPEAQRLYRERALDDGSGPDEESTGGLDAEDQSQAPSEA
jgi:hypothetical protein